MQPNPGLARTPEQSPVLPEYRGAGVELAAVAALGPTEHHAPFSHARCARYFRSHASQERHRILGGADGEVTDAVERRPHQLGSDAAARAGQAGVDRPRCRYVLSRMLGAGKDAQAVADCAGRSADEAGREVVLAMTDVEARELGRMLEGGRVGDPYGGSALERAVLKAASYTLDPVSWMNPGPPSEQSLEEGAPVYEVAHSIYQQASLLDTANLKGRPLWDLRMLGLGHAVARQFVRGGRPAVRSRCF